MHCMGALAITCYLPLSAAIAISNLRGPRDDVKEESWIQSTDLALSRIFQDMPFTTPHNDSPDSPIEIQCEGKNMTLPKHGVVLENPGNGKTAVWCPNAKIGTSTFTTAIVSILMKVELDDKHKGKTHGMVKHGLTVQDLITRGEEQELCNAKMSFTFIRNPWDRLISAYVDKVNEEIFVPGHSNATFAQFLNALKRTNPNQMNAHFKPVSSTCLTKVAKYTNTYKIEHDFDNSIEEVFETLGISRQKTRQAMKEHKAENQNSYHHRGLSLRKEMYNTPELQEIVAMKYADDIAFGNYAFNKLA